MGGDYGALFWRLVVGPSSLWQCHLCASKAGCGQKTGCTSHEEQATILFVSSCLCLQQEYNMDTLAHTTDNASKQHGYTSIQHETLVHNRYVSTQHRYTSTLHRHAVYNTDTLAHNTNTLVYNMDSFIYNMEHLYTTWMR